MTRWFEDIVIDEVFQLGSHTFSADEIIRFATLYDPQYFHLDAAAAQHSHFGGLVASGWQTGGLSLRMLVDSFLNTVASAGGLGFTDLKWKNPVMVGDTIGGTVTIADLRRSGGHPQWGIMTLDFDVRNQKDQPVLTMRLANLIDTRQPEASA